MNQNLSTIVTNCQICSSTNLTSELFVGYLPPVNKMVTIGEEDANQPFFPLEMFRCKDCSLVQIGVEVDQTILFPEDYPYLSGTTRILRDNFKQLAEESKELLALSGSEMVVDIGSNDGTLLTPFKNLGFKVLGIEPSKASDVANKNGVHTLMRYFSKETANEVAAAHGKAKVVTAANVFAHIADVHSIVEGILDLLDDDGCFISESHYLLDLLKTVQYDTIYHEHLRYYSLTSLKKLFAAHGLEIFHARRIPTHGGSVRVYAARKGQKPISKSVQALMDEETEFGLNSGQPFEDLRSSVSQSKLELYRILADIKKDKQSIVGIGAPSRASTLINHLGLDASTVDCIYEVGNSHKLNKYIPGTKIPVVDEKEIFEKQPDFAILFSWHIGTEIAMNLRKKGYKGKFITPLPVPKILDI